MSKKIDLLCKNGKFFVLPTNFKTNITIKLFQIVHASNRRLYFFTFQSIIKTLVYHTKQTTTIMYQLKASGVGYMNPLLNIPIHLDWYLSNI